MAGDEADLVADLQAVGGAGNAEAAVLVGGAPAIAAGSSQTSGGLSRKRAP
jgi:hypothetical protein